MAKFDEIVAYASPELRPVCLSLQRIITSLYTDYTQTIWRKQRIASFGIGAKKMSQHYAYIAVHASHVNLGFYHGASLTDRARLLKGTGKKLRHVSFRDVPSTKKAAVSTLLRQAIAERVSSARGSSPARNRRPGREKI